MYISVKLANCSIESTTVLYCWFPFGGGRGVMGWMGVGLSSGLSSQNLKWEDQFDNGYCFAATVAFL